MRAALLHRLGAERGFTLVEMIIVVFLLALAMLGILAVFDASARINKSETEVADAQGAVRFGLYRMTSAIRMAGSGGLYVTQAVLNHADPQLPGMTVKNAGGTCSNASPETCSYDNVEDGTVVAGRPVRTGTDMIEIRGVINSPLIGFDRTAANGCGACQANNAALTVKAITGNPLIGTHVNEDTAQRPQFQAIDDFTAGAATTPMFVVVSENGDIHVPYNSPTAQDPVPTQHYPQPSYNVGVINAQTTLFTGQTFGTVDFTDATAIEFNSEFPNDPGTPAVALDQGLGLRHAGILEDVIFFIDNTDSDHPVLAQGTRRGNAFDVVTLADDVEDMQVSYGVDLDSPPNEGINRRVPTATATDPDLNVSNQPQGDEWVPNVPGADNPVTGDSKPFRAIDFVAPTPAVAPTPVAATVHFARLHGVMVSLVARSKSPDPTYRAPLGSGLVAMNAAGGPVPAQYHRRRVQTIKINLRNYSFD